ncbi:exosome complex exonuclease RRP42-like [Bolinopsis microptera]|uniref:exosome complex exonuclease RRP42-like n=1 Tax=Bolinopsis microptera TaxID=2820187 RepID=UPI00307AE3B7
MNVIRLSSSERKYIIDSIEDDFRTDGRSCEDYRQIEIETRNLPNTNGSSRCRIGKTEVLVGVKAEVVDVDLHNPTRGKINIAVDCSATASPQLAGRGSETIEQEILSVLNLLYSSIDALNLTDLCIVKGESCWLLNIDVLFVGCGGNIFDAASVALKAALHSTTMPNVSVSGEGIEMELEISDDPYQVWKLSTAMCPICVTLYQEGESFAVDVTEEESECSEGYVHVGVLPSGEVSAMEKSGAGNMDPTALLEMIDAAVRIGMDIHKQLDRHLHAESTTATL